uniref:Uncharacterized protein n=1 Tax=Panagrolaimus sp. PS1159 TaxID=55785 RepID=A0AC35GWS7_9BILA
MPKIQNLPILESESGDSAFKSIEPGSSPRDIKKHLCCSSTLGAAFNIPIGVDEPESDSFTEAALPDPDPADGFDVVPDAFPLPPPTFPPFKTIIDFSKKSIAAGSLTDFLPFFIIISSVPI